MVLVRLDSGVVRWSPAEFRAALSDGRVTALTNVSIDEGRNWTSAAAASKWLEQQKPIDAATSLLVPVALEPRSVIAGYVALASFFLFGGPVTFVTVLMAFDGGPTLAVRLGAIGVGLLLGPLPIAGFGWWALRAHRADASLRGVGRAWFALVVAALLTLALLAGLVKALLG